MSLACTAQRRGNDENLPDDNTSTSALTGLRLIVGGCWGKEYLLHKRESMVVPIGSAAVFENPGLVSLEIIEVQIRENIREDDILMFDNDFGRTGDKESKM